MAEVSFEPRSLALHHLSQPDLVFLSVLALPRQAHLEMLMGYCTDILFYVKKQWLLGPPHSCLLFCWPPHLSVNHCLGGRARYPRKKSEICRRTEPQGCAGHQAGFPVSLPSLLLSFEASRMAALPPQPLLGQLCAGLDFFLSRDSST